MRISTFTTFLCLASLIVGTGCASGSSGEKTPPGVKAVQASHRKVRRSVEDAYKRSENLDRYEVRARYNPPRCEAPGFEVFAHGRWTRAYVESGSELEEKLESLKSGEEVVGGDDTVWFRGKWRGRREAETGLEYPVFRVGEIQR